MKPQRILELYIRIKNSSDDYTNYLSRKRRAPTLSIMVDYINNVFGEFGITATVIKETLIGTTYSGYVASVYLYGKDMHNFSNIFGNNNSEFADFVMELHKEYIPNINREISFRLLNI